VAVRRGFKKSKEKEKKKNQGLNFKISTLTTPRTPRPESE